MWEIIAWTISIIIGLVLLPFFFNFYLGLATYIVITRCISELFHGCWLFIEKIKVLIPVDEEE